MELEIRHLRALCAIAQCGSISAASARLGVSQPALTTQLQRLERMVGEPLFVRQRSGAVPTELGGRLIARARLLLSDLDAFVGMDERRETDSLVFGSVHLDCLSSLFPRLEAALSPTELRLHVEPSSAVLLDLVARHQVDAGLVAMAEGHEIAVDDRFSSRTLVSRVPVFVAMSDRHRLAGQPSVRLEDLATESWIEPPGAEDGSLSALLAACERAGFTPRIRYTLPSGAGGPLLASGHAVRVVEPTTRQGDGVVVRPLAGDPLLFRLDLITLRNRLSSDIRRLMHRELTSTFGEMALATQPFRDWWTAHPEVHPMAA